MTRARGLAGFASAISGPVNSTDLNVGVLTATNVTVGGTITYEDVSNVDSVGVITARNGIHALGSGNLVGIGTNSPESRLHLYGTFNSHLRMTNTSNDALDLIGDANKTGQDSNIFNIKSKWNGTDVARISFKTGYDTTDKDDAEITFHTKDSGSSIAERLRITNAGVTSVTGSLSVNDNFYPTEGPLSNRNLVINGAMRVAQRNTSTSTITGTTAYRTLDRFKTELANYSTVAGTVSQSTEAPTGFSKSIRFNVTTAETIAAADLATIRYRFEGQDVQNLEYGTSNAKTTTLSFWVRSSITGTYGLSVWQADAVRNLGLTYSVNTADTWEYKTLTIPGDTSGTINDDTGEGLQISWTLSAGSNFQGTANTSWAAYSADRWATGHAVDLMGATSNFYLTGVQLEVGTRATPFEHRNYADELQTCKRYYQNVGSTHYGAVEGTNRFRLQIPLYPHMRTAPTCTVRTGKIFNTRYSGDTSITTPTVSDLTSQPQNLWTGVNSTGLTAGTPIYGRSQQGADGDFLAADAEL